jgi:hypothetical protein
MTQQIEFMTEALWGVGSTPTYGHDGRSVSLTEVILRHAGEAQESRDRFKALSSTAQAWLHEFLGALMLFRLDQLDPRQRNSLLADLIDLYHDEQTDPATKPHIEKTVRVLAGENFSSVLAGAASRKAASTRSSSSMNARSAKPSVSCYRLGPEGVGAKDFLIRASSSARYSATRLRSASASARRRAVASRSLQ